MKTTSLLPIGALFAFLSFHCSTPKPLSDAEKAKLDSHLVRLLTGERVDNALVHETVRNDGTTEYDVIVRSERPEDIHALGITVGSVFGDVVVVHKR